MSERIALRRWVIREKPGEFRSQVNGSIELTSEIIDRLCRWIDDPLGKWWLWAYLWQARDAQQAWLSRPWWRRLADWGLRR